jgi:hypothetical protein
MINIVNKMIQNLPWPVSTQVKSFVPTCPPLQQKYPFPLATSVEFHSTQTSRAQYGVFSIAATQPNLSSGQHARFAGADISVVCPAASKSGQQCPSDDSELPAGQLVSLIDRPQPPLVRTTMLPRSCKMGVVASM